MKVKIIKNLGNEYYNQFIGEEHEAIKTKTGLYMIDNIKTKTPVRVTEHNSLDVYVQVGTQWFPKEVKKLKDNKYLK